MLLLTAQPFQSDTNAGKDMLIEYLPHTGYEKNRHSIRKCGLFWLILLLCYSISYLKDDLSDGLKFF